MSMGRFFAAVTAALIAFSAVSCSHQINVDDDNDNNVQTTVTGEGEKETTSDNTNKDSDDINSYIKVKEAKPAVWKVTDTKTGSELYMLGILRFATEYTFAMPDYVNELYDKSSGIVIETDGADMTKEQWDEFYNQMFYNDGTTVKDHISKETYEKAKKFLQDNFYYNEMSENIIANGWASQVNAIIINRVKNLVMETLDASFTGKAKIDGKPILGLEDMSTQTKSMNACSDELTDFMISDTMRRGEDISAFTANLANQHDSWAKGDVDVLDEEYYWGDRSSELDDDYAAYLKVNLYERNENMAEKIEGFLENGDNYFIVIGVTHFSGKKGIDDILEEKGYKVERIDRQ